MVPEDAGHFRKRYGDILPHFEAARLASSERIPATRLAVSSLAEQIVWHNSSYRSEERL